MQLVAYGAQDAFLTEGPQYSFWRTHHRSYTNFANESIEVLFEVPEWTIRTRRTFVHVVVQSETAPTMFQLAAKRVYTFLAWTQVATPVLPAALTQAVYDELLRAQVSQYCAAMHRMLSIRSRKRRLTEQDLR